MIIKDVRHKTRVHSIETEQFIFSIYRSGLVKAYAKSIRDANGGLVMLEEKKYSSQDKAIASLRELHG